MGGDSNLLGRCCCTRPRRPHSLVHSFTRSLVLLFCCNSHTACFLLLHMHGRSSPCNFYSPSFYSAWKSNYPYWSNCGSNFYSLDWSNCSQLAELFTATFLIKTRVHAALDYGLWFFNVTVYGSSIFNSFSAQAVFFFFFPLLGCLLDVLSGQVLSFLSHRFRTRFLGVLPFAGRVFVTLRAFTGAFLLVARNV